MEKVLKQFSDHSIDSTGNKESQLLLSKKKAYRAGQVILEATHKLSHAQVPSYMEQNFENSWQHFDQNGEGWLRYEECHTFMRYFMAHLNKFTLAPGSITDLESGGKKYPLTKEVE
mmetsp:Transcript_18004/g.30654  ORF Transcript_18004/g.30654 Transcript_18004/m.30654 type:complete len:116 (+) Transcript_18004:308-655(+)